MTTATALTISKYDAELSIEKVTLDKASVNLYSVAADPVSKAEAFDEYEIVLSEKPKTNIFTLPFTSKDLVFYYQPPLTQELDPKEYDSITETEAWKDGKIAVYRPENIVGSYAVYHTSKSGGVYGTGKAFHIYRPWAQDAKGVRTWCSLKIEKDALTITVPQTFLDKAIYPVVVDPTFGYTSIGGTTGTTAYLYGCHFTAPEDGSITSVSIYSSGATINSKIGIYSDNSGAPNALLATSSTIEVGSAAWNTHTVSLAVSNGVKYWFINAVSGSRTYYFDAGSTSQAVLFGIDGINLPDPANIWLYEDRKLSIYATYTASSTGQPYISRVQFVEGMRTYGGF